MKKAVSILLATLATLSISACQSDKNSSSSALESSSSPESSSSSSSENKTESQSSSVSSEEEIPKVDYDSPEYEAKVREMLAGTGEYANMPTVTMDTDMGTIKIRLFPSEAPKAVENFMTLAKKGYYDGLTFHRVINDFMIQGGDPTGNGTGGESIWGKDFEIEYSPYMWHFRGALSMANTGMLDSNGSQFFIVQAPKSDMPPEDMQKYGYPQKVIDLFSEFGGQPFLDLLSPEQGMFSYSKFGYVYEGMDVVDKIAAVKTNGGEGTDQDMPVSPVKIVKVTVNETNNSTSSKA